MKHENTISYGVMMILAIIAVIGAATTVVALNQISTLRYELSDARSDVLKYREGYADALTRVEELEWQLNVINGGAAE